MTLSPGLEITHPGYVTYQWFITTVDYDLNSYTPIPGAIAEEHTFIFDYDAHDEKHFKLEITDTTHDIFVETNDCRVVIL